MGLYDFVNDGEFLACVVHTIITAQQAWSFYYLNFTDKNILGSVFWIILIFIFNL